MSDLIERIWKGITRDVLGTITAVGILVVLGFGLVFILSDDSNDHDLPPIEFIGEFETTVSELEAGDLLGFRGRRCNHTEEVIEIEFASSFVNGGEPLMWFSGIIQMVPPGCFPVTTPLVPTPPSLLPGIYRTVSSVSYRADSNHPDCSNGLCSTTVDSELFEVIDGTQEGQ